MDREYANKGLSGLVNLGNTCWLNSAVQIVSNIHPLTDYFFSGDFKEDINVRSKEYRFVIEWLKLLKGLWSSNCTIQPISFHRTFNHFFDGGLYSQEDSEEGLSKILDLLHEGMSYEVDIKFNGTPKNKTDVLMIESIKSWNNSFKKSYSKIVELFYGQYLSCVKCMTCGYESNTFEPFSIIQLPIKEGFNDINDCFSHFVKTEKLEKDELWDCSKCHSCEESHKKILLWKSPFILIIQLKRFDYLHNCKINTNISYPLTNFNLTNYIDGYDKMESLYNLVGIIEHIGSLGGGHYISHIKNKNNKWYTYNDNNVSELNKQSVNQKQGYILVYQKK